MVGTHDWTAVEGLAVEAERAGGVVGIAVRREGRELFARHGGRRFRAASTIKVPILIAAYRRIERGEIGLDERHLLRDTERTPGSGVLGQLHGEIELTFGDLLYLMMAVSDNTATNLVIDRVGLETVNATMHALGMADSVLGRRMLGRLPDKGAPDNWSTPRDLALAIEAIVGGTAAGAESCARMIETLQQQQGTRRLSRFLDEGGAVRWGSKPGSLPGICHDAGFITTGRGTLSLAVCCENLANLDVAERTIGEIAREAVAVAG